MKGGVKNKEGELTDKLNARRIRKAFRKCCYVAATNKTSVKKKLAPEREKKKEADTVAEKALSRKRTINQTNRKRDRQGMSSDNVATLLLQTKQA